jgi:hypothetical protein
MNINKKYNGVKGIYCIKNNINDKIYIGSSKNVYGRLTVHKSSLKHNRHYNTHLQNSVNKYGINNFSCFLFTICTEEELIMVEDIYIEYLKPNYNQKNASGTIINEKVKEKISNSLKQHYIKGMPVQGCKKVLVYDRLTGIKINEFNSIRKTSVALKINESSIRKVLLGIRDFSTIYIFRYENDNRKINPIILNESTKSRKFKKPHLLKINKSKKPITVINIITNEISSFLSYKEAALFFNFKKINKFNEAVARYNKTGKPWKKQFIFKFTVPGINSVNCLENPEMDNQQPS